MPGGFSFMCLDLRRSAFLVWSCARARALQEHTQLEWQPYRDSKVLNAIYSVLFGKGGPGTAEIRQDQRKVDEATKRYFDHMFDTFLEKAFTHGPVVLVQYVDNLVFTRTFALECVQQTFMDASAINADVAREARNAIQTMAKIKLYSALTLTGTGCYLALAGTGAALVLAGQVGLEKLATDVTGEIIKPHDHIGANVKGTAYQVGKYGAEKGSDKLAEHAEQIGERGLKEYGPQLASAEQRIERYSTQLLRRLHSRKAITIGRRLEKARADQEVATRALQSADHTVKVAKFAGKALPLVFAAWDIIDAVNEYKEYTEQSE